MVHTRKHSYTKYIHAQANGHAQQDRLIPASSNQSYQLNQRVVFPSVNSGTLVHADVYFIKHLSAFQKKILSLRKIIRAYIWKCKSKENIFGLYKINIYMHQISSSPCEANLTGEILIFRCAHFSEILVEKRRRIILKKFWCVLV